MVVLHWRRFRASRVNSDVADANETIYSRVDARVHRLLQRRPEVQDLDRHIKRLVAQAKHTKLADDWLLALIVQAPRAVLAQIQMDRYPHGYRDKQTRLFELIDFNDAFVSTVLALPEEEHERFADQTKEVCDNLCKEVGAPCFTNDQWGSIVRGLSREIALYLSAKNSGFQVFMTSRAEDALGIDMQIRDPDSKRYINVDCKTPSSFRYRLTVLVREGRLRERDMIRAQREYYAIETNGHSTAKAQIVLLCLHPDVYEMNGAFSFKNNETIRSELNRLIRDFGLSDDRFAARDGDFLDTSHKKEGKPLPPKRKRLDFSSNTW